MVFFFLSCLWRCFLSLGGGGGGGWGWGHDNVLSFPSSLRFMLTRQWCYALGFLGFMLTRQWCYALDFLRFMLTRQWCYAIDFLRCYVNTSVMWRSWLSSLLCSHVSDVTLLTFFGFMFKTPVMLRRFLSLGGGVRGGGEWGGGMITSFRSRPLFGLC